MKFSISISLNAQHKVDVAAYKNGAPNTATSADDAKQSISAGADAEDGMAEDAAAEAAEAEGEGDDDDGSD